MERNLKFLQTWSVPEFKQNNNVQDIEILQNPATGKVFFSYGAETGACSRRAKEGELTDPVVSRVCSADTGDMFYLLHQRGEGGAMRLGVL